MTDHRDISQTPEYLGGFLDALKMRDRQEAERAACTCGHEESDGRMDVLNCVVHGPDARRATGGWRLSDESGIPITVTQPDDPAMVLLSDPNVFSTPKVHRRGCYICEDPEFAAMGLPLCRPCPECGGHIAADDEVCDDCGLSDRDVWEWETDPTTTSPFMDLSVDECWP